MNNQGQFNFDSDGQAEGYTNWVTQRRLAIAEQARRLNLPLGYPVEVWLRGGVRLRGKLQLREEKLFLDEDQVQHLEPQVDQVPFAVGDMESCVRLD